MDRRCFRDCFGCVFVQSVRIKAIKNDWHLFCHSKNPARECGIFTYYLLPFHSYLTWQDFLGSNR